MKKRIISILAVVLVVAMMSVVLVACATAPKTMDEAKANLIEKGYEVLAIGTVEKGGNISFYKNSEDGKIGATAVVYKTEADADAAFAKAKAESDKTMIDVDAQISKMEADLKATTDEVEKAELKQDIKELKAAKKNYKVQQAGNWVAVGDKRAIKDLF